MKGNPPVNHVIRRALTLWCQRLEAGRYHFPDAPTDAAGIELSAGQFRMILDGIDLTRVRRFKRFRQP